MSKIKIIIVGIIVFLLLVILGLVWNIGRNQKPSQEIVDKLTNTFAGSQTNSQKSTTPDFGSALISNFSNNSQNNLPISASFNYPNFTNSNSEISQNRFISQSSSYSQIISPNFQLSPEIKNSILPNKIAVLDDQSEVYDIPTNKIQPILPTILPNLINYPNLQKVKYLWLYNPQTNQMEMFGQGTEKVMSFSVEKQNYQLLLAADMRGYGEVFWTNQEFENPQKIDINNGENIVKMEKTDNPNLVMIETNNSQFRPIPNQKYLLNLEKLIKNQSDYWQKQN